MPAKIELADIVAAHQERVARLEALEDEFKRQTSQLKKEIAMLEGAAHKMLIDRNDKSVRTDHGTAFRQRWSKAKVTDMEALWAWAVENNRRDLFPKSVNKTVVDAEIERVKEETGENYEGCPIPGVEIERGWKCHIRKSPQ